MSHNEKASIIDRRFMPKLIDAMTRKGIRVYLIETRQKDGRIAFLDAIQEVIQLSPPVNTMHWDALDDSMFNGLDHEGDGECMIFWIDASVYLQNFPEDFRMGVKSFEDVACALLEYGDVPTVMRIFVGLEESLIAQADRLMKMP